TTADLPLYVDDTPGLSIGELRSRARQAHKRHGIDCIVVDYLQLMCCPSAGSREQEISAISRGLKDVARSLRVPVVALSQLNRSVEQRENKRPRLSDLRESGAIEQDADLVAFLYRHSVYDENFVYPTVAELNVAKQRNGPIGKVHLHWQDDRVSFSSLDRDSARDYETHLQKVRTTAGRRATDDL
ncbi:MAG: replicative DNA helicase, partial [Bradymonadaceae bacterium]